MFDTYYPSTSRSHSHNQSQNQGQSHRYHQTASDWTAASSPCPSNTSSTGRLSFSEQSSPADSYGRVDWAMYNYIASHDGGYWRVRPEHAHKGAEIPEIIPHHKPVAVPEEPEQQEQQQAQQQQHESHRQQRRGDEEENRYPCLQAGCRASPFKRPADLQRHYTQVHQSSSREFKCDYHRCARRQEPFGRRDHYRDHLRVFHLEDIIKRGNTVTEEWLQERHVMPDWWRCSKCLIRVNAGASSPGHVCPQCNMPCEEKRKRLRGWR